MSRRKAPVSLRISQRTAVGRRSCDDLGRSTSPRTEDKSRSTDNIDRPSEHCRRGTAKAGQSRRQCSLVSGTPQEAQFGSAITRRMANDALREDLCTDFFFFFFFFFFLFFLTFFYFAL